MGLTTALTSATSGLLITQDAVSVTASNIANVDSPGYTRKNLNQEAIIANGRTIGVQSNGLSRAISPLIQRELRDELTNFGYSETMDEFYKRIDALFGAPGSDNAIDTIFNDLTSSLSQLTTTPESIATRNEVISNAQVLAHRLNTAGGDIQTMRGETERQLDEVVERMNVLLNELEQSNEQIISQFNTGNEPVDLLDARDKTLEEMSAYMDLNIVERDGGGVAVFTTGGMLLFDFTATQLTFDGRGQIDARKTYDRDPDQREVGTISILSASGRETDLVADNGIRGGRLGALLDLRDDVLVEAQRQLDEFAGALSRSFSDNKITSPAIDLAGSTAHDIDLGALQPGDPITLTLTDNATGEDVVLTFVGVNDPSLLPLGGDATARNDDTVIGLDFSGGHASVVAQLGTALASYGLSASDQGGTSVRLLDDNTAPNDYDIASLEANVTAVGTIDEGLGFPLFVDSSNSPKIYSGSLDSGGQLIGFANRISVNETILDNPERIVVYSTSPATNSGDPSRPQDMLDRLSDTNVAFSSETGLGGSRGYSSNVGGFLRAVTNFQGTAASVAQEQHVSQEQIVNTLQEAYIRDTGVNVDEQLTLLIELQNAYSANARVVTAVNEMIETLLQL